MAIYMAPIAEMQKLMEAGPEAAGAGMEEWARWAEKEKKNLADMGAPLGKTKRVTKGGTKDVKNDIGGYSIILAESHDEAAKLFGPDHPHFKMIPGAYVEILEIMPMLS